jgi:hypothetical protein
MRSQSIKANTLKTLDDCNIPHECIKVFVSNDQIPKYRASLPSSIEVIEGALGCIENRAKIREYYPEGKYILYMDDDIKGIFSVCDMTDEHSTCHIFKKENLGKSFYKKQIPIPDLTKFITKSFEITEAEGAHLWGIYPISNGFFASHRYVNILSYICGGLYGEINVKDFTLRGDQYSEDFERSCEWFKRDGKIIRFESVLLKTGYYKGDGDDGTSGGLVATRTVELSRLAQEKLQGMYPEYLEVVPPSKGNKYYTLKVKRVLRGGKKMGRTPSATSLV